ncbi:hypothetical protein F9K85_09635 [Brucella tritici]|uniref:hypothetical protein n=1 Tax=Brucella tritici TaxID=94626 RepID=UPI00124DDFE9|nr:hypothetical protein [Brucella tritici]KAB2676747.1 hypothetical protein F9K85_09635 [Brucella tritici]
MSDFAKEATPDATGKCGELERYGQNWHDEMEPNKDGEYVRFDQAEELLAAERERAEKSEKDWQIAAKLGSDVNRNLANRANALEADNAALTARVKELEDKRIEDRFTVVDEMEKREALENYAREATKAITGLTGGGSENFCKEIGDVFTADLPYCLERIRERYVSKVELKRLEAKLTAAKDLISRAQEIIPGNYMHWHDFARAALGGKPS